MQPEDGGAFHLRTPRKGLKGGILWVLDLLFPSICPLCGSPSQDVLCEGCLSRVVPCREPLCPRCGLPYPPEGVSHLCSPCERGEYPFLRHRSFGLYEGVLREALHRFKFGGDRSLARPLGEMLLEALCRMGEEVDLVVPVPLSKGRLLERGFNQSLLLALQVSRRTGLPCRGEVLVKVKETPPQSSLGGRQRRENVKGAFRVRDPRGLQGRRVLLVDDVFTTGATLSEAARVLLRSGARAVTAVTVARRL